MAINKTINIPNLIPGKRYRMVVEPNIENNEDWSNVSAPSIEFLVPSSPNLLSIYTPTVERSTARSTAAYNVSGSPTYKSISITGWTRTKGTYTYKFYISGNTGGLVPGTLFKVDGMSTPPHEYYDALAFTVSSLSGTTLTCTASYDTTKVLTGHTNISSMTSTFCHTSHFTTGEWVYRDGRSLATATTSNNGTGYWTIPGTTSTVSGTTVLDVKMTIPSNVPLYSSSTVIDVPYFFYTSGGNHYYLDGTSFTGSVISLSSAPTPGIRTSGWIKNVPNPTEIKNYKFSIARYINQGSSWVGDWLQRDQSLALSENSIVYSKEVTL